MSGNEGRAVYKVDVDVRNAQAQLDGVVKGALPKFEKLSGSINAASSAFGGLGGKAGQTLGALKQAGEAFLVGGPIALGIAALATGAGILASRYLEAEKASEELAKTMRESQLKAANETRESYATLGAELARLMGTSAEYRVEMARAEKQRADMAAAEAKRLEEIAVREVMNSTRGIFGIGDTRTAAEEALAKASIASTEARTAQTRATNELEAAEASLFVAREKATKPSKTGTKKDTDPNATPWEASAVVREAGLSAAGTPEFVAEEKRQDDLRRQREQKFREQTATANRAAIDEEAQYKRDVDAAWREAAIENIRTVRDEGIAAAQAYAGAMESATIQAAGLALDVIEAMAAGQKVNFESMAAGFVRSVGEQIMGIGIRQMFEGAGLMIMSAATRDPAQLAAGAGLFALGQVAATAGGAMAASGAVWQGSIAGRSSGGGGGGGGAARTGTSRDAPEGRNREQAVTIVYNGGTFLGDPSEGARRFERNRRRSRRDVFVPAEV